MNGRSERAAARVRAQIVDGILMPGEPAPSGAALARATGYGLVTCRKALRTLIKDGVLVPGLSPGARPRVPVRSLAPGEVTLAGAARALSAGLAARRRAAGLTQPQLAAVTGVSVTTIGHAETGRLWHSRDFWELTDKALRADGTLLALHDAYRAAAAPAGTATPPENTQAQDTQARAPAGSRPAVAVTCPAPVASVTITWADGTVTTVSPPDTLARFPHGAGPQGPFRHPAHCPLPLREPVPPSASPPPLPGGA